VRIQRTDRTDDGAGGATLAFVDVATVWADVQTSGGREVMEARKVNATVTHVITMRYRSGLTPAHRIIAAGAALNVLYLGDPDGKRTRLVAQCEQIIQPAAAS
jgi:SPP1 family predicted phage head-tail adaptor